MSTEVSGVAVRAASGGATVLTASGRVTAPGTGGGIQPEQRASWDKHGFFIVRGFAPHAVGEAMLERVVGIVRDVDDRGRPRHDRALVLPESNLAGQAAARPEDAVSKVFRLHRDPVFRDFGLSGPVAEIVSSLVGPDVDLFLSQFIFKSPGAWGQPWHQDSWYFPFEPARPVVGIWLAVTAATLENGCLHVLPGSQSEPVHEHVPDRRPNANYGYVEIVDHDMSGSTPVLMEPGDLLVFDSHLMHRSTDNVSDVIRAAMVYHYAAAGTKDDAPQLVHDWMPAVRSGSPLS